MSRVGSSRPAWSVLRPFLLAAAAATSWLAISASSAMADSSSGQEPLLGDVRSSVSTLTSPASGKPAPSLTSLQPVTPPARHIQSEAVDLASTLPRLQSITPAITTPADKLLGKVPVVSTIAPLPSLTDSVAAVAELTVSAAAGTAKATVSTVVEWVSPIVSPVVETATGAKPVPLPSLVPGEAVPHVLPGDPGTGAPGGSSALRAGDDHSTGAPSETSAAAASAPLAPSAMNSNEAKAAVPYSQLPPQAQTVVAMAAVPEDPSGDFGEAAPEPLPGLPGSSSGASASTSGHPQPAWLSHYHLELAASLSIPAQGTLLEVPSPVSFDPGSSPD